MKKLKIYWEQNWHSIEQILKAFYLCYSILFSILSCCPMFNLIFKFNISDKKFLVMFRKNQSGSFIIDYDLFLQFDIYF